MRFACGSVHVDLSLGKAVSSAGGVDELRSIESVLGSVNSDTIRGDEKSNFVLGFWGQDVVDGAGGPDWIYATYSGSVLSGGEDESPDTLAVAFGVSAIIDLSAGVAMAREDATFYSRDVVARFENATGSDDDDLIVGDANANLLEGSFGNDEVVGGLGNDYLFGEYVKDLGLSLGSRAAVTTCSTAAKAATVWTGARWSTSASTARGTSRASGDRVTRSRPGTRRRPALGRRRRGGGRRSTWTICRRRPVMPQLGSLLQKQGGPDRGT